MNLGELAAAFQRLAAAGQLLGVSLADVGRALRAMAPMIGVTGGDVPEDDYDVGATGGTGGTGGMYSYATGVSYGLARDHRGRFVADPAPAFPVAAIVQAGPGERMFGTLRGDRDGGDEAGHEAAGAGPAGDEADQPGVATRGAAGPEPRAVE